MVYCTDLANPYSHVVEVQILDDYAEKWAGIPKNWQCAAIFGRQAATKQLVRKAGQWNRMTVTCRGPLISVALNGQWVTELDMKKCTSAQKNPDGSDIPSFLGQPPLAQMPTKGHIGLQGKHQRRTHLFSQREVPATATSIILTALWSPANEPKHFPYGVAARVLEA